jgi:hypothetical protein
MAAI